jgi:hypothetical protein
MSKIRGLLLLGTTLATGVFLIGCGSGSSKPPAQTPGGGSTSTPAAVAQETNPPGDIPDNQVFVSYHSAAGGYALDVPEGWSRTESGTDVKLVDKFHAITVEVTSQSAAPTTASAEANDLPRLQSQVEAFEKVNVTTADLPAGKAVLIRYRANSVADSVTGKKTRLEIDRYEVFKNGKVAALSLSAPAGSDNVDVWNQISRSFKWD